MHPMDALAHKREFMKYLSDDEVMSLLRSKANGRSSVKIEFEAVRNPGGKPSTSATSHHSDWFPEGPC